MITGNVDPEKLDPDSEAFKKRSTVPSFDPHQSSVLAVVKVANLNSKSILLGSLEIFYQDQECGRFDPGEVIIKSGRRV